MVRPEYTGRYFLVISAGWLGITHFQIGELGDNRQVRVTRGLPSWRREMLATCTMAHCTVLKIECFSMFLANEGTWVQPLFQRHGCFSAMAALRFGNRGMNKPVVDLRTQRCYITSQNHGFAVDQRTLPDGPFSGQGSRLTVVTTWRFWWSVRCCFVMPSWCQRSCRICRHFSWSKRHPWVFFSSTVGARPDFKLSVLCTPFLMGDLNSEHVFVSHGFVWKWGAHQQSCPFYGTTYGKQTASTPPTFWRFSQHFQTNPLDSLPRNASFFELMRWALNETIDLPCNRPLMPDFQSLGIFQGLSQ